MTLALLVAKIIADYKGYRENSRKEDDNQVKQTLLRNLTCIQNQLKNIYHLSVDMKETCMTRKIKDFLSTVDFLNHDIEYSLSGHSYPFFSPQCSVGSSKLDKLIRFDLDALTKINQIHDMLSELEGTLIDETKKGSLDLLNTSYEQLTEIRMLFKNRIDLIKDIS